MWKRDTIGIIDTSRNAVPALTELIMNMPIQVMDAVGTPSGARVITTVIMAMPAAAQRTTDTATAVITICPDITQTAHAARLR
jgi:hypothetical protein